jgi:hypothetical protein
MMGAQKWTVLGPTGELKNLLNPDTSLLVASAASDTVDCARRWANVLTFWRAADWRKVFWMARRPNRADMMAAGSEGDGRVMVTCNGPSQFCQVIGASLVVCWEVYTGAREVKVKLGINAEDKCGRGRITLG